MPKTKFNPEWNKSLTKEERISQALKELESPQDRRKGVSKEAFTVFCKELSLSEDGEKELIPIGRLDIDKVRKTARKYYEEKFQPIIEASKNKNDKLFNQDITEELLDKYQELYSESQLVDYAWHIYNQYNENSDVSKQRYANNARDYLFKKLLEDGSASATILMKFAGKNYYRNTQARIDVVREIMKRKEQNPESDILPTVKTVGYPLRTHGWTAKPGQQAPTTERKPDSKPLAAAPKAEAAAARTARAAVTEDDNAVPPALAAAGQLNIAQNKIDQLQKYIEETNFSVRNHRLWKGGRMLKLVNGDQKRVPHRVYSIYEAIKNQDQSDLKGSVKLWQQIQDIAQTALARPYPGRQPATTTFYQDLVNDTVPKHEEDLGEGYNP